MDLADPASPNRAPYSVALQDVVMRFNTSPDRRTILQGFLNYRAALHAVGLTVGMQWLDGSFLEHIEVSARNRPPADIDVVTFYRLPAGITQRALLARAPDLFPSTAIERATFKGRFHVDGYMADLASRGERLVGQSAYWYSLWSHQRDTFKWKGFLQIDLSPGEDASALALLAAPLPGATP